MEIWRNQKVDHHSADSSSRRCHQRHHDGGARVQDVLASLLYSQFIYKTHVRSVTGSEITSQHTDILTRTQPDERGSHSSPTPGGRETQLRYLFTSFSCQLPATQTFPVKMWPCAAPWWRAVTLQTGVMGDLNMREGEKQSTENSPSLR